MACLLVVAMGNQCMIKLFYTIVSYGSLEGCDLKNPLGWMCYFVYGSFSGRWNHIEFKTTMAIILFTCFSTNMQV